MNDPMKCHNMKEVMIYWLQCQFCVLC